MSKSCRKMWIVVCYMVLACLHLSLAGDVEGLKNLQSLSYDGTEASLQKIQDAVAAEAKAQNLIALNIHRQTMYGLGQVTALERGPQTSSIRMTPDRQAAIAPWLDLVQAKSDGGDPFFKTVLGILYMNGEGVDKDKAKCIKLWGQAAEAGYPDANHKMGIIYAEGQGENVDGAKAVAYYLKAVELGSSLAAYNLGCLYHKGKHVSADEAKALEYWLVAAEKGHPTAQRNAGLCYLDGVGTEINYARAKKWIEKAVASGDENAPHLLKERFGLSAPKQDGDPGHAVHNHGR